MVLKSAGKFHFTTFAVIVLLVIVTDVILFARLGAFSRRTFDTSISLSAAENVASPEKISEAAPPNDSKASESGRSDNEKIPENNTSEEEKAPETNSSESEKSTPKAPAAKPGGEFFVNDSEQVWGTSTSIELFKSEYVNGENTVTAKSLNGEKIIAPGTENSYTFSVVNDRKTAVNYDLKTTAVLSDGEKEIEIPIKVKLYDGKGEYIAGSRSEWAAVDALNSVDHSSVLGADRYENFTLDWRWDFESGSDALDTALGDLTEEKTLTCEIQIDVLATANDEPHPDDGNPNTGFGIASQNFGIIAVSVLLGILAYSVIGRRSGEGDDGE